MPSRSDEVFPHRDALRATVAEPATDASSPLARSAPDRYSVLEILDWDGIATLARAREESTGRAVLLKAIDPRRSTPVDLARLRHEYDIALSLALSSVARPIEMVTHAGMPALVFEDWGGEPLSRAFATPLPMARFLPIAGHLAAALADLHQLGVVHKDLKPHNIFIHPGTLEVKLGGLGLATPLPRAQMPTRPPHLIEGSLPYMSPEQTGRTGWSLDSRSDLYSLGVTFYQLLTGHLPFEAGDPLEWIHFHLARMPAPPSQVIAGLPEVVSQIVLRLLAKAPEERYQTARGLGRDLARCRELGLADVVLAPFPLGEHDLSERLQLPQKLYGRDAEVAELAGALARVDTSGVPELVVVSGYSGIGKSSLVQSLVDPTLARGGLFASAKSNPQDVEIPYSTLAPAFRELVLRFIAAGEEQAALWRARMQAALGPHAYLVLEIVPELELLVGPQARGAELAPGEAKSLFHRLLMRFVGAFARPGQPLTLFLDDLQWIDSASLAVLQDLATEPEIRGLLLVGAYRDNEVTPTHPLARALEGVRAAGARVTSVVLGPLGQPALTAFVAEALRCQPWQAAPLAEVIRDKTAANPFFVAQFMSELCADGLLWVDQEARVWRWDLAQLLQRSLADNVAEILVERVRRLPSATQEALKQLAFLGRTAEVSKLAWVLDRSEPLTRSDLWMAQKEGLVVAAEDTYKFAHDRFREAVCSLVADEARPALHLRLGRILLSHLSEPVVTERLLEAVNHLDRGLALLEEASEREAIGRWNLLAARRAKDAVAYASASAYLDRAVELLSPEAWREHYRETFDLFLERCECKFLGGDFDDGDALARLILERACSEADRVRVERLRIRMYELAGRNNEAMEVAGKALARLGMRVAEEPGEIQAATEAAEREVAVSLRGRSIDELAAEPDATSPAAQAALGIIADSLSPAYMAQRGHFPLLGAMGVNLCLREGHAPESSSVYNSYALVRAGCGDFPRAFDFSDLALRLLDRVDSPAARGIVLFRHGFFINHWRNPIRSSIRCLSESDAACLAGGNLLYTGYARFAAVETRIEAGDALDEIIKAADEALELATSTHSDAVRDTLRVQRQLAISLKGGTREPGGLEDDSFSAAQGMAGFAIWRLRVYQQMTAYLFGRYDLALEAAAAAQTALTGVVALMLVATHHFFRALTLAALHDGAEAARRVELAHELAAEVELHRRWAEHCPANFANRHALLLAEAGRLEGNVLEAERRYEEAIRSARENGFVQNEAIAFELAARFYQERGLDVIAGAYLSEARACYLRWGAAGKVAQLEQNRPEIVERRRTANGPATATFTAGPSELDLLSVVKASQTISREIEIDKLAGTLLEMALAQGGARRGCLLLARGGSLTVEAEAVLAPTGVALRTRTSLATGAANLVPLTLVRRAQVSRQPLALSAAELRGGPKDADAYLAGHRPQSLLCLPILRGDELIGLIYLENDLVEGAFTPSRLTTLSLLASQVAISMENALLLARERRARASAEFLAEAGVLLSESLDFAVTLGKLATLAVKSLADWCVVDVVEPDDAIRRVAGVHVDASKGPLLEELVRSYPPTWTAPNPSVRVFRAAQPMLFSEVAEAEIQAYGLAADHVRLLGELGYASVLAVPLVTVRGRVRAALTLVSRSPGHYGEPELALTRDLAARASIAFENARLFAEAQQATQLQARANECLRVEIQEHRQAEAERRRAEEEVRRLNSQLEQRVMERTAELKAANHELDAFAYSVSHDLRAPLRHVSGFVELLGQRLAANSDERSKHLMSSISESARRMGQLIDDLLSFSRLGRAALAKQSVDLKVLARDVVRELEPDAAGRIVAWRFADLPVVAADRALLRVVLVNLLSNALKFTRKRERAEIEIGHMGQADATVIFVRDNGAGFEPEYADKLFGVFQRLHRVDEFEGTGIGLAIVRRIILRHGGKTWAEGKPGVGATFFFSLPV